VFPTDPPAGRRPGWELLKLEELHVVEPAPQPPLVLSLSAGEDDDEGSTAKLAAKGRESWPRRESTIGLLQRSIDRRDVPREVGAIDIEARVDVHAVLGRVVHEACQPQTNP
jgi:hypothetical protein